MRLNKLLFLMLAFPVISFAQARVISNGGPYTDSLGNVWSSDATACPTGTSWAATTHAIAGTPDAKLYQAERYATPSFVCTFTEPAGNYSVTIKFAEDYFATAASRVFNVSINGTQVLTNFDIFAKCGGEYIACDQIFPVTSTGTITITFGPASVNNPKYDAIQILPTGASTTPPPVVSGNYATIATGVTTTSYVDSGVVSGETANYYVTASLTGAESVPSNVVTGTTPNTSAVHSNTLAWMASATPGVTYNVYRQVVSVPVATLPPGNLTIISN